MDKKNLPIAEPCDASWEAMTGDEKRRFCSSCDKHVHHLSEMTRREAESLLASEPGLCVRYSHDERGRVRFERKEVRATAPIHQSRGANLLVARAASFASLLTACAWPIADRHEPILMGTMPVPETALKQAPIEPAPFIKPDRVPIQREEPILMGEPIWEPELIEMGDVAIDLDPIYQQEHIAAEELSQYNITLEEEEILPCDGEEKPVQDVIRPELMGRIQAPEVMIQGGLQPMFE